MNEQPAFNRVSLDYNKVKNQWKLVLSAPSFVTFKDGQPTRVQPRKVLSVRKELPIVDRYHRTYDPTNKQVINLNPQQKRENKNIFTKYIKPLEVEYQRKLSNGILNIDQNKASHERFSEWIEEYALTKKKKNTRTAYTGLANRIRHNGDPFFAEIDAKWINNFHKQQAKRVIGGDIKQSTARKYFDHINFLLHEAERDGKISNVTAIRKKVSKVEKGESRQGDYFTLEEMRMLDQTDFSRRVLKRAFLFCCWSGLRFTEAQGLKWGDVKEDNGITSIVIQSRKNKVGERIKLPPKALEYMGERLENNDKVFINLKYDHANKYLTLWAKMAGIDRRVYTHDARRSCAAIIWNKTKNTEMVRMYLNHKDLATTNRYLAKFLGSNYASADPSDIFPAW